MRLRSDVITAIFGVYFVTVVSGAILVATRTDVAWYDAPTSSADYAIYLFAYLVLLIAIPIFASMQRSAHGRSAPLNILAGPAIVAAVYVGIASMLLPGAGGMLQSNFRLNTAVILSLAYSWIGLALYFAVAVGHVLQERPVPSARPPSPEPGNGKT